MSPNSAQTSDVVEPQKLSFWMRYRASIKPLSVEEPIDVIWHRLLAYGMAKALLPTPVEADAVTVGSIVVGVASAVCLAAQFPGHLWVAAALCTLSAVFDCADGALARLRKRSSSWGRALDGFADLIVMAAISIGAVIYLLQNKHYPLWFWGLAAVTAVSCTHHFGYYDHYKNVYLRLTEPTFKEGEDAVAALERARASYEAEKPGLLRKIFWEVYVFYVTSQDRSIRRIDPYSSPRLNLYPPYDAERAAIYRKHCLGPMRLWRGVFGLGTHVFVFSLAIGFDRLDWYVWFRAVFMNLLLLLVMVPWQRHASAAAFEELGLHVEDAQKRRAPQPV